MASIKSTLIFVAAILNLCEPYNILGIFPIPGINHFLMFKALFRALAEKGHEVDVISHFPLEDPPPGYNDHSIRGTLPNFINNMSVQFIRNKMDTPEETINLITRELGIITCEIVLNTDVAKELKNSKKKFDLVVTEIFGSDCMLGFGHLFNAPVVSVTTSVSLPWGGDRVGNPDNPSYIPNYFTTYSSHMTLLQRVQNTILLLVAKYKYSLAGSKANIIARNYFGEDLPDLEELAYKTSLIMVNTHHSINYVRPAVPNLIEVAGLHIPPIKPLPKHLEEAINTSSYKGVIYLSMGSMVLTETFEIDKLEALCAAFRDLPYKVLWKATIEKMPKELSIPPNVHFETWMPQVDILCHPNTKLFIAHGGLMGSHEAVYCGVPRIGIPLFADQELNLKASEAKGLAIMVKYEDITKSTILSAIKEILENSNYSKNAKIISERFKDRPMAPLDMAVYWVEYVIRHKGAHHLRSPATDLPWYQYHLLDVGAILIGAVTASVIVLWYSILYICKICNDLFNIKAKCD